MKKKLFGLLLIAFSNIVMFAQKTSFEGIVKYDVTFDNAANIPAEAAAMLKGSEIVIYIKGDKQRADANMMLQKTTSITDNKNKTVITLMDVMGQKYLIQMSEDEVKKELANGPETEIKPLEGTKMIAGYTCKKAQVTIKKNGAYEMNSTVYYTEEIPSSKLKPVYKGLNGCPLEYSVNANGINMKFTAKSISKESISDGTFEPVCEGYTKIKAEDLQKQLMQQMQNGAPTH